MSTLKTPFRYDFVGSFLRPEKLKEAKKNFEEGKITQDELNQITDDCVRDVVAKQKAAGFHDITDGEFRRKFWHLDFMWGFEGVAHEFSKALSLADHVVLAPIYAARETDTLGVSSDNIKELILNEGGDAVSLPSFDEIETYLLENLCPGDMCITMGAGDIVKVGEKLLGN